MAHLFKVRSITKKYFQKKVLSLNHIQVQQLHALKEACSFNLLTEFPDSLGKLKSIFHLRKMLFTLFI